MLSVPPTPPPEVVWAQDDSFGGRRLLSPGLGAWSASVQLPVQRTAVGLKPLEKGEIEGRRKSVSKILVAPSQC